MAETVVVTKLNNSYIRIDSESDSVLRDIWEFFTFRVDDYENKKRHMSKYWKGEIRLFHLKKRTLYLGLLEHLVEFCNANGYEIVADNFQEYEAVSPKAVFDFVKRLQLPKELHGLPFKFRDYQYLALHHAVNKRRCVIVSPTASGKSLMIYSIIRYLQDVLGKKRGLLVVPTTHLVEQMYGDFESYSSTSGWDVESNCQKIYQGHSQIPVKPLVISTWQSIYEKDAEFFSQFDYVIGDEAHGFDAESLKAIMEKLVNCDYRIGTTGSLKGEQAKVHKLVLQGLFGMVKKIITTKELMDRDEVAKLQINCVVLRYPPEVCKEVCKGGYEYEMEYIRTCPSRNEFIKKLALSLKGNTLLLFNLVEKHGKPLYEAISAAAQENRKVFFIFGGTDVSEREQIRKIVEKESDAIILASYKIFSTGSSIRNLHNVVLSVGTKSRVRVLQTLGRSLRLGDNKESANAYDIVDDFRFDKKVNSSVNHYMERVGIYTSEKFPFKSIRVRLDDAKVQEQE